MAELSEIERTVGEAERATSAGDHAAAERALRRVLRLQEAGLGLSHPDVSKTLNDLAAVCERLGRPDEAEFLYRRALGIARRTLQPDHPYIGMSLENLSNLYQAQGRPEKLDKIREGRSPGSGLPDLDVADEAGDGAAATGEMARAEKLEPVPALLSDEHLESRPHSMSVAALYPGFLIVGAFVALMSILWLLFGGPADPGGVAVSSGSEAVAAAARAAASDSGAGPSAPRPGDGAETTNRLSPEPAAERPEVPLPSAVVTSSAVAAAEICSQLETRTADGAPLAEWQCEAVVDRATPGRLFFYTRVRSRTSTTVEHRWLRNGVLQQQVALDVEANDGPGYRTYSSHTVSPEERGAWRVELRLGDQELLHAREFVVP